jgi:hypothetical protein
MSDLGSIADQIIERKRRLAMPRQELDELEQREANEQYFRDIAAEAERAAKAASTKK